MLTFLTWIKSVSANYVYSGEPKVQEAVQSGIIDKLVADIEANYKSRAYPTVYPTFIANDVLNGGVLFVGTSAGTAGELVYVAASTAHQAGVTISVSADTAASASTATISISDTAANNTASAVVTAWNANTSAAALATASLYRGTLNDGTSRNDGTGLVPAFAQVTMLQSNTYQKFGLVRMVSGLFGVGHP